MLNNIRGALAALTAALVLVGAGHVTAQTAYPSKPVKIVVGFVPGGGTDQVARYFAQKLSDATGQPFLVENRAGAGGNIGANSVATAAPDGYTLLMVAFAHAINPGIYKSMPFDTVKSFTAVGSMAQSPIAISVNASSQFKNLAELIAYAKANPGKVAYGSAGRGTLMHVGMELFSRQAGIELLHVPFNGSPPSIVAVVGNQLPVLSSGYGQAQPFGVDGKGLRILAISTPTKSAIAPNVPTISEAANLPGYAAIGWLGFVAPAGTPKEVINTLYGLIDKISDQPATKAWLADLGMEPFRLGPDQFQKLIADDVEKWGKVVSDAGIEPQ